MPRENIVSSNILELMANYPLIYQWYNRQERKVRLINQEDSSIDV